MGSPSWSKTVSGCGGKRGGVILTCLDFDTATELGMDTTAGSFVLLKDGGEVVGDAFVIKQLRNAGAIILAKANLMEMGSCVYISPSFERSLTPHSGLELPA